ncbi:hypothetical protein [Pyxidicoccus sp. MSG2]|uniref:hypothetical protein n=1 Tax=Pyxidicoccus sp. MSG2 TaxID=2996790 RepID=UPI00226E249A|nr:hypothetical protein [Pyxidicoccus sp. MSG2]MCY1014472.1 hypothetical protein [Pyxidicoccus sp. MSG2]
MTRFAFPAIVGTMAIIGGACFATSNSATRPDVNPNTVAVAVPARAGAVTGTNQNSDEFIWRLLAGFAAPVKPTQPSPVVFETWASDADVFSYTPHWPGPNEPKKFQRSVLERTSGGSSAGPIDVSCATPGNAAVGGFPTHGTPTPCIAEEVKRNRPQYDYIVNNNLNTQAGLRAAYAKSFQVVMPTEAISVKGDWVPVQTLLQWLPSLGSIANIQKLYYTNTSGGVEYALVSLHVSSRQNTNWVWGTFEHQMNPGRCDDIGCYDTFGATNPAIPPNRTAVNTQYGACEKTPQLAAVMAQAGLSAVWNNYCLKSTMVDYTAPDGTPYALGNSVIERIVGNGTVAASSCIACHVYASFGSAGTTLPGAQAMLPYNPTGKPIPAVLDGSLQFDFMWGVLLAPPPPKTQ